MLQLPVYLDYNATTPCDPRVVDAMLPYFTNTFGNAASHHHPFGWAAAEAVDHARQQVAQLIGADVTEIVFTSGATEAINLAIKGIYETYAVKGRHIISAVTEHKAVLDSLKHLEKQGAQVTYLNVNNKGCIDLSTLEAAITPNTILIAIMYANNETGVINPIREISAIAKKHGILLMSDATQAVGKIPVNVNTDGIDLMSCSAHKMYGPKGVGALYVRRKSPRVKITAQLDGGGHERGMRSGTLNVPGIVGFGKAGELCISEMNADTQRIAPMRNRLEKALLQLAQIVVNGAATDRLPNTTNLSFRYMEGSNLITGFHKTLALSTGAACTSALPEPSHVLTAMGLQDALARASFRFSLGRFTTEEQIDYTIRTVTDTVNNLRTISPLWEMYKSGVNPDEMTLD